MWVLLLIIIFGYTSISLLGRSENIGDIKKIKYNGINFILNDAGYWSFNKNGYDFLTKYNPEETENISVNINLGINDYINEPLYISIDYQESLYEVYRNFGNAALRMQKACLNLKDCDEGLPLKNCSADNFIQVNENEDNESIIYQKNKCIFINTSSEEQTRYIDKFLFEVLNI